MENVTCSHPQNLLLDLKERHFLHTGSVGFGCAQQRAEAPSNSDECGRPCQKPGEAPIGAAVGARPRQSEWPVVTIFWEMWKNIRTVSLLPDMPSCHLNLFKNAVHTFRRAGVILKCGWNNIWLKSSPVGYGWKLPSRTVF